MANSVTQVYTEWYLLGKSLFSHSTFRIRTPGIASCIIVVTSMGLGLELSRPSSTIGWTIRDTYDVFNKPLDLVQDEDASLSVLKITEKDVDVMVRTVIGEAATEPELGQVAVAWVILTRAKQNVSWYGGNSVSDVAQHKAYVIRGKKKRLIWQFEPWMSRSRYLWNIKKESELYKRIQELVKGCISGKYADPTGGATHFLEPDIVRIRRDGKRINGKVVGGSLPTWAQGEGQRIGNHVFFKLDEPAI